MSETSNEQAIAGATDTLDLLLSSRLRGSDAPAESPLTAREVIRYLSGVAEPEERDRLLAATSSSCESRQLLRSVKAQLDGLKVQEWGNVLHAAKQDPIAAEWVAFCRNVTAHRHAGQFRDRGLDWRGLMTLLRSRSEATGAALLEVTALARRLGAELRQPRIAFSRGGTVSEGVEVRSAEVTQEGDLVVHLSGRDDSHEDRYLTMLLGGQSTLLARISAGRRDASEPVVLEGLGPAFGLEAGRLPAECFAVERDLPSAVWPHRTWVQDARGQSQIDILDLRVEANHISVHLRLTDEQLNEWTGQCLAVEHVIAPNVSQRIALLPLSNWRTGVRAVSIPPLGSDSSISPHWLQFRLVRES